MLSDPQSITINAVAKSLPLTGTGPTERVYTSSDGAFTLRVKQNVTRNRFRREVRVEQSKIAADPLTAVNQQVGASVYIVIDEPRSGFTDAELGYLVTGLHDLVETSGFVNKILGGEM